jgi:tetratricopeptide (TPR) repeat protein
MYTRTQGSVADRLSFDAMREFRQEARTLAARVTDERILARYMAADAFYPFWLIGSTILPTAADLAASRANAEKAVTIARSVDDPNLESMALDALSSTSQMAGDWQQSREYARQRLTFQDRLSMAEKTDAHSMVTWSSALLGDLDEAERVSAQGLAQIQPGQVPAWTLQLVVWRAYVLTLLGRWDEALQIGERARQLWLEARKPAAGYAIRGFMAVIDVARARQDDRLAESYREILETILTVFPPDSLVRQWLAYAGADLGAIADVVRELALNDSGIERAERGLNLLLDAGEPPGAERLTELLAFAEGGHVRALEAQVRRGLGIVGRDRDRRGALCGPGAL